MYKILVLFVAAYVMLLVEGQLTFTSSWGGKRSMMGSNPCHNNEAIANIFKALQVSFLILKKSCQLATYVAIID